VKKSLILSIKLGFHGISYYYTDNAEYIRYYVEDLRELADIDDINEQTIIYEGTASQIPRFLSEFEKSKDYTKGIFRLGVKAENLFKEQAQAKKFVVVAINQSQEDFAQYKNSLSNDVKRGDFFISNARVDVDIKCKTIYEEGNKRYFFLNESDVVKHLNMMEHTGMPVIIALYERLNDDPNRDALHMIEVTKIEELKETEKIKATKNSCYKIYLSLTVPGFDLLEGFRVKKIIK
jgi:hypothetical protein